MILQIFLNLLLFKYANLCDSSNENYNMEIVSREQWGARKPRIVENFSGKIPFVIIHHSYQPPACHNSEECKQAMQSMQNFHQLDRNWNDIGYSFGIGGDGQVYMGRGYNVIGAHAPRYNDKSIGICMIGDWRFQLPPEIMLSTLKKFLKQSVDDGYLKENYMLMGHRQVRDTECPGDKLYQEIQTWDHYISRPRDHTDLTIPN